MEKEIALFPTYSAPVIREAFGTGKLEEFVARSPAGGDAQTGCRLILEYAQPREESPVSYPIYASLEDMPVKKPWYWPRAYRQSFLRQIVVTMPELLTLRPLFPKLARLLESQHAELLDLPADVLPASAGVTPPEEVAVITALPEPYHQNVHNPTYALKVNLLGLTPLLFILAGAGLVALGVFFVSRNQILLSFGPFVLGGASGAWGIYVALYCMAVYENRWAERRLRTEIGRRPNPLLDPADPEAVYLSLIPRDSWAKVKWTMASDLLLMRIDNQRREVLLEGDCDRYRIPAGAIAECEPQCFFHPIDKQQQNELWMVRLKIQVENGLRELLLSVTQAGWGPRTNATRLKIARDTCQKINSLRKVQVAG
jgi:hypothetical protein